MQDVEILKLLREPVVIIGVVVIILAISLSGGLISLLRDIMEKRHERKKEEARHKYRIQILAERRHIAESLGDSIKLLVADDALGEEFNQRLSLALKKARVKVPVRLAETRDSEIDVYNEEVDEVKVSASQNRKSV